MGRVLERVVQIDPRSEDYVYKERNIKKYK